MTRNFTLTGRLTRARAVSHSLGLKGPQASQSHGLPLKVLVKLPRERSNDLRHPRASILRLS